MRVSAIAAMAQNRVIGQKNRLPWNLPEDLKRFRETTLGHTVIMGRKTIESIGRPLPKRKNIVVTRNLQWNHPGVVTAGSLEEALSYAKKDSEEEAFVIGGGEIYQMALPRISRLYLTLIHQSFDGDAFFPDFGREEFREIFRENREDPFPYSFVILERLPRA